MMPLKPKPKAVATKNRPTSSWVSRKHAMATAWQAEPAITVRNPPTRSARAPHAWRATKAAASMVDSMAAPCVGLMPMSPQKATMCADGIDIGMQQQNAATQTRACTTLGWKPATLAVLPAVLALAAVDGAGASGAGLRKNVAGTMNTRHSRP